MAVRSIGELPPASAILPGAYTVDTLPDPAGYVDTYARVTDLFGSKRDLVLASQDGATAFWQPVRPVYKRSLVVTADMTLQPLKSPSVAFLSGAIGTGTIRQITLGTALAFPGACFEIRNGMSGLGTLKIGGLALGALLSLIGGASSRFFYDATDGWQQFS